MKRDRIYDAMKKMSHDKFVTDRKKFLEEANKIDDGGWVKHTEFHWSRMVCGHKLDYWPSRRKWQWCGKVRRGDVYAFIKRRIAA